MLRSLLARKNRALAGVQSPVGRAGRSHRPASQPKASAHAMLEALEGRQLLSTYYISTSGNDSAAGTSTSTPWKTIAKVNSVTFKAGDSILFQGGQTFSGNLNFDTNDGGGGSNSVKVSSYGTGRATISAGAGNGIYIYRTAGFDINNININGNGGSSTTNGIVFTNPRSGGIDYSYIRINNVDISGFGNGVNIVGVNGSSGFNDIAITNGNIHHNRENGVLISAPSWIHAHSNVTIKYVSAHDNYGSFRNSQSGNGIFVSGIENLTIERCVAFNNGATGGDGNYGIFVAMSNKVAVQFCESFNNISRGGRDGGGFDFDFGVTNALWQYNYSHGNHGNGFGLAEVNTWDNLHDITIRYNVSENDGRNHQDTGIKIWGTARDIYIYNNTVFTSPSANNGARALRFHNAGFSTKYMKNIYVRNNIFVTTGGVRPVDVNSDILRGSSNIQFQNNVYYSSGSTLNILWGSSTYTSLSAWQAGTGQEKLNGAAIGYTVNPQLNNAGYGGTVGDVNKLYTLTAYQLKSTSPVANKGLNLKNMTGVSAGSIDYFGTPLYQGTGFDIGADEYGGYNGPPTIAVAVPTLGISVLDTGTGTTPTDTGTGTTPTPTTNSLPAVPAGLKATKRSGTMLLDTTWSASTGASVYRLAYRKVGAASWTLAYQGAATGKTFTALTSGTYEIEVAAGNSAGYSTWSPVITATL